MRLTGIKCGSSNKTVSDYKCFFKANSRTNTTINVFENMMRPIFYLYLSYDLIIDTRHIQNARSSMLLFDICSILNGTGSNPVFHWMLGNLPDLQDVLHSCPYKVKV